MKWWKRKSKRQKVDVIGPFPMEPPEDGPLTYPMPPVPPGAVFLGVVWTCGGCGGRWEKRVHVDQPEVSIACPVCDVGNPAALLVTEAVDDDA